jgi:tRNA(fMet)-specific endonuclease VapC
VIHLDTSFVIDLLRETGRRQQGPARKLLETISEEPIGVSVFVVCELYMGAELSQKPLIEKQRVSEICSNLHVDFPDERFAPAFAKHYAHQENLGQRISTMDLLIATSATLSDAPLVTRNTHDFARVPGLKLMGY